MIIYMQGDIHMNSNNKDLFRSECQSCTCDNEYFTMKELTEEGCPTCGSSNIHIYSVNTPKE